MITRAYNAVADEARLFLRGLRLVVAVMLQGWVGLPRWTWDAMLYVGLGVINLQIMAMPDAPTGGLDVVSQAYNVPPEVVITLLFASGYLATLSKGGRWYTLTKVPILLYIMPMISGVLDGRINPLGYLAVLYLIVDVGRSLHFAYEYLEIDRRLRRVAAVPERMAVLEAELKAHRYLIEQADITLTYASGGRDE